MGPSFCDRLPELARQVAEREFPPHLRAVTAGSLRQNADAYKSPFLYDLGMVADRVELAAAYQLRSKTIILYELTGS